MLTIDDVMLQVQRIYVNRGLGGKDRKSKVARKYRFIYSQDESYYATFEGLYR